MSHSEQRFHAVYIISVAAELTGVHPQTLRVYERRGLVAPARTGGMSRRYSQADIERIQLIQELTSAGLNLSGVARVIEMRAEIERLQQENAALRAQVESRRADLVPLRQDVTLYDRSRKG